ncbi:MAG: flagellar hook-basal body complex protein FliE [Anaerovoracaceae bacterium]
MAVIPIGSGSSLNNIRSMTEGLSKPAQPDQADGGQGFKAVFEQLIDKVEETEAVTKIDAYKLSIGETDDLHTMMINAAKADIALQTMVQLRNKILDAYSEVMRINL